jgi:type VI secretion system protein
MTMAGEGIRMGRGSMKIARRCRHGGALLLAAAVAGLLGGCAAPSFLGFKGDRVAWKQVTLAAAADANGNSPVAVDVVLISDEALQARVAELPASKWFASRADLASTYPTGLRYRSWELVPGQRLEVPVQQFDGPRVTAAYVFANYPEPGAYRVRIAQVSGTLAVQLDNNAFTVMTTK